MLCVGKVNVGKMSTFRKGRFIVSQVTQIRKILGLPLPPEKLLAMIQQAVSEPVMEPVIELDETRKEAEVVK